MPTQINFIYDNPSSIDAAIKEMQAYQEQLTYKCHILAQRVAEIGVEIARVRILRTLMQSTAVSCYQVFVQSTVVLCRMVQVGL